MNKVEMKEKGLNQLELHQRLSEQLKQCPGRVSFYLEMNGNIFEHNSDDIYSSASLIKIPILIEGYRQHQNGIINLDQIVHLPVDEKVSGAGVLQALSSNPSYSIRDLLTLMMIVSDNFATNILIDTLGKGSINQCMDDLGLNGTKLNRKMMDFESLRQGIDNLTCAQDMAKSLKFINESPFLTENSRKEIKSILGFQQFNQKLPAFMDLEKVYVGNKTGELPGVNHDCAIVSYNGRHAYMAMLIDQLPLEENSNYFMNKIGKMVYDKLVSM
ncbi:serine hydrolase [Cytobacillus sp. FJAT-54145]|uniref:Serine hydrolase n=1 Tax=Cytobacillus spartinae TaxID=3299023 RepID=A0ABW6KCL6_9BACI